MSRISTDLSSPEAVPYFNWDAPVTNAQVREALATDGAGLVAQIRQMQIKGWLRPAELPPRQPAPGPASP